MENKKIRPEISNNKQPTNPAMPTMRSANHAQAAKPAEATKQVASRPVAPVKPAAPAVAAPKVAPTPVKPINNIPANKPATSDKQTTSAPTSNQGTKSAKKKDGNKKKILFCLGLIILIAVIAVVVVLAINNSKKGAEGGEEGETISPISVVTEEEKKITKETLDKYTEITVEGYKAIDNNPVANAAVIVSVKNISNETVSLAIVMAAMDDNDNVLETSSIYAEGIEPGQTHTFETFVYTELTPDQLKNAKFKAYKASTYEAPTPSSDGDVAPAPEETKEDAGEAATE